MNKFSRSGRKKRSLYLSAFFLWILMMAISASSLLASEKESMTDTVAPRTDAEISGSGGAAASNPLAAINNTDLKWTYIRINDPNGSRRNDYWIRGGWQFARWGKLNYELTYQETNITGSSQSDWESLSLKPIFFFKSGELGSWKYRMATGFEWIIDFDNRDKGIGTGSDLISPLFGLALLPRIGTILVPLVQHFVSYSGPNVNTTGFRLIGIQSLPYQSWVKLDLIVPYDWERDSVPATLEVELGQMSTSFFGVYVSGLTGIGGDRTVDWGASLNIRFVY